MSSVDWNAVRKVAEDGGAAPEGMYNIVLDEATAHQSGKGYLGLKLKLKIEDGPYKDLTFFHYLMLMLDKPRSVPGLMEDLKVLGIANPDRDFDEIAAQVNSQPRRMRAELVVDEYNGTKGNKLKSFSRLQSASGTANGSFSIAPPPVVVAPAAPFIAPPAPAVSTPPPAF